MRQKAKFNLDFERNSKFQKQYKLIFRPHSMQSVGCPALQHILKPFLLMASSSKARLGSASPNMSWNDWNFEYSYKILHLILSTLTSQKLLTETSPDFPKICSYFNTFLPKYKYHTLTSNNSTLKQVGIKLDSNITVWVIGHIWRNAKWVFFFEFHFVSFSFCSSPHFELLTSLFSGITLLDDSQTWVRSRKSRSRDRSRSLGNPRSRNRSRSHSFSET